MKKIKLTIIIIIILANFINPIITINNYVHSKPHSSLDFSQDFSLNYSISCLVLSYNDLSNESWTQFTDHSFASNHLFIDVFHGINNEIMINLSISIWGRFRSSKVFSFNKDNFCIYENETQIGHLPFFIDQIPKDEQPIIFSSYFDNIIYIKGKTNFWEANIGFMIGQQIYNSYTLTEVSIPQNYHFYEKYSHVLLTLSHGSIDYNFKDPLFSILNLNISSYMGYMDIQSTSLEFLPFPNFYIITIISSILSLTIILCIICQKRIYHFFNL